MTFGACLSVAQFDIFLHHFDIIGFYAAFSWIILRYAADTIPH